MIHGYILKKTIVKKNSKNYVKFYRISAISILLLLLSLLLQLLIEPLFTSGGVNENRDVL